MNKRAFVAVFGTLVLAQQAAHSYPGAVFQSPAPAQAPTSESTEQLIADVAAHSVSHDGAAEYAIPFAVPPGRQGLAPSLGLSYSSRNPIRGGLAAGWTMSMPRIEVDTARGRLNSTTYRSSLSGTRLMAVANDVPSGNQAYRAELDTTYARYERVLDHDGETDSWKVLTTDGRTWYFGETATSKDVATPVTPPGRVESRWFLNRVTDAFGNEIRYAYAKNWSLMWDATQLVEVDIYPTSITWGSNPGAGLAANARVTFEYGGEDRCPDSFVPIGAQLSFRTGTPLMLGAARLTGVRMEILDGTTWRERRRYDLGYDTTELACPTGRTHAPLRLLTSVQERVISPTGTVATMPASTFEYGRRELELTQQVSLTPVASGRNTLSPHKAGGWPTLDSMLLDFDGDGRLDLLWSQADPTGQTCGGTWQRNRGNGAFDAPIDLWLPTIPWGGTVMNQSDDRDVREGCSLAAQFSRVDSVEPGGECGPPSTYNSYRFMDMTGDGRPDLVTAIDANRGQYRPEQDDVLWPDDSKASCPADPPGGEGACRDEDGVPQLCHVLTPFDDPPFTPGAPMYAPVDDDGPPGGDSDCPLDQCHDPACQGDLIACPCGQEFCESSPGSLAAGNPWHPAIDHSGGDNFDGMFWTGPGAYPGDVGGEGKLIMHGNHQCQMWPEVACGRYVWRVYDNTGAAFADTPRLVLSPVPLESDRPVSSLGAGALAASSSWHGFLDIDGDGYLDAIYMEPFFADLTGAESGTPPASFQVFLGDANGDFHGTAAGAPWQWSAPALYNEHAKPSQRARVKLTQSGNVPTATLSDDEVRWNNTAVTLADMNGDGLPDYVDGRVIGAPRVRVFYNNGRGFESPAYLGTHRGSTLETGTWGDERYEAFEQTQSYTIGSYRNHNLRAGWSRSVIRTVDIDVDGLLDVVMLPEPTLGEWNPWIRWSGSGDARLFVNVGDKLVPMGATSKVDGWWAALARITLAGGYGEDGTWVAKTDFIDLDGDGLPEAYGNGGQNTYCTPDLDPPHAFDIACGQDTTSLTTPRDGQGMRLLKRVTNGRGGDVRFAYEPVAAGAGRVPHPVWAVSRVTVNGGPGWANSASPDMVTTYSYQDPVFNADSRLDWGFRGFAVTRATAPTGAVTVSRYDHALHWGGLLVDRRVLAGTHVESITKTSWRLDSLFEGRVPTYHPRVTENRTCGATQTEAQCETSGVLLYQVDDWRPRLATVPAGTTPLLYTLATSRTSDTIDIAAGTRVTGHPVEVYADASNYRVRTTADQRLLFTSATAVVAIGHTVHTWDSSGRVETSTSEFAGLAAPPAVTSRQFDLQTGNLTGIKRASNQAQNIWTTFAYDARKTFVTQTINEYAHTVDETFDPATGAQLSRRGPNSKGGVREGWARSIDGRGRVVEEKVYVDTGTAYAPYLLERIRHIDAPNGALGAHTGSIVERRIEITENRWTRFEARVDGLARTVKTHEVTNVGVKGTSRYAYDATGALTETLLPSPSGTGTVGYSYAYDTVGRRTRLNRPDGSAQRWIYDGAITTREDVPTGAGGMISKTRSRDDAFGRLVEVAEIMDDGTWATTAYGYDGNDNVSSIVDADGVSTSMLHDWRSRRTQITRDGRTWRYGYDADGHLTSILAPHTSGPDSAYLTTIIYDVLGRETSRIAGSRALTSEQLTVYGAASVQRFYDEDPTDSGLGRLSRVVTPLGTTSMKYEARGLVRERTDSFSIYGGTFFDARTTRYVYNALGGLREETYGDGTTAATSTRVQFATTNRGLPESTTWLTPTQQLAAYTHADDRQQLKRYQTGVNEHEIQRDSLGRVTRETVKSVIPSQTMLKTLVQVSSAYSSTDDVTWIGWALAPNGIVQSESFAFVHDRQHQLIEASGPLGYTASFDYSPAGKVNRASVDALPAAVQVDRRAVTYAYQDDSDRQTPDRLISADQTAWLQISHDDAGNTTGRTRAGMGTQIHVNDGFDRQREVIRPDGNREVYWYDGDGQRAVVATWGPSGITRVRWAFGETEIWKLPDNGLEKTIAHVAHGGQPIARIENGTALEYVFADHHGHTLADLSSTGVMLAGFVYGPFGEILRQAGAEVAEVLHRFNGKEQDATTGLSYYGHRYYDPASLTWTQADPLYRVAPDIAQDEPRRLASYAFSLNNPLRFVDPDGLEPMTALGKFSWGGTILSGGLAINDFRNGDYGSGAFNTLSMLAGFVVGPELGAFMTVMTILDLVVELDAHDLGPATRERSRVQYNSDLHFFSALALYEYSGGMGDHLELDPFVQAQLEFSMARIGWTQESIEACAATAGCSTEASEDSLQQQLDLLNIQLAQAAEDGGGQCVDDCAVDALTTEAEEQASQDE